MDGSLPRLSFPLLGHVWNNLQGLNYLEEGRKPCLIPGTFIPKQSLEEYGLAIIQKMLLSTPGTQICMDHSYPSNSSFIV